MKVKVIKIVWEDGKVTEVPVPEDLSGQVVLSFSQGSLTDYQEKKHLDIPELSQSRK